MIEELLHWEVKNKNLRTLGKKVEEINEEFLELHSSLDNYLPNIRRARSLNNKIENMLGKCRGLKPKFSFDGLIKKEYADSLSRQSEFLKFFFFKNYNKDYGVRLFLEYMFTPEKYWPQENDSKTARAAKNEKSAVKFLEDSLRKINYYAITKRENLMRPIEVFLMDPEYLRIAMKIKEELPRIRKLLRDYNLTQGFVTKEQHDAIEVIENKKDLEENIDKIKSELSISDTLMNIVLNDVKKEKSALFKKASEIQMTKELEMLTYNLDFVRGDYCGSFNPAIGQMEVTDRGMMFYEDKKTGKMKFYAADLYKTCGHENFHLLQQYFSMHMPPALCNGVDQLSITTRVVEEGVALYLENTFFNEYLQEKSKNLGISKLDLERSNYLGVYLSEKIIRFCHSMYHREQDIEETDYETHKKLAEQSRNWALADDKYLNDDAFEEVFEFSYYIFGHRHVEDTMNELEQKMKHKLGTTRKARNWIKRNSPTIMQGLMTGGWGWTTHKDFFLNHYMEKAMKYCE